LAEDFTVLSEFAWPLCWWYMYQPC